VWASIPDGETSGAWRTVLLGLAALVSGPVLAIAQTDAPASYTDDLWSRPGLTGDWWESRDWLTKRGVTLDLDLLQVLQGVATGGRDTGVAYDGLDAPRVPGARARGDRHAEHASRRRPGHRREDLKVHRGRIMAKMQAKSLVDLARTTEKTGIGHPRR